MRRRYQLATSVGSPILQLDLEPEPSGLRISCEFLDRAAPFSAKVRAADGEIADVVDPEPASFILSRLWNLLVWNLWLNPLLQRRAMSKYGPKLLSFVKSLAEEDGIVAEA